MQFSAWIIALLPVALGASVSPRAGSVACNNSPDLCSRSYSQITHLGAHDSPFVNNESISSPSSANQNYNVTVQLNAGVRLVSAQVHNNNGSWDLCHTSCGLLNVGSLSSWLAEIKAWMDKNVNDVVTILLVNSDNASPDDLHTQFQTASITSYAFTPNSTTVALSTWPTLQSMIANSTRLVTFVASLDPLSNTVAPYLLDEFTFVFENPFEVTSPTNFSCTASRPASVQGNTAGALGSGRMPLMNHFLDEVEFAGIEVPDVQNISTTNAPSGGEGNLGTAATTCNATYDRAPTFILVDFFDQGPAIATVDRLNGITAVGRTQPSTTVASSDARSMFANLSLFGPPSWNTLWIFGVAWLASGFA